MIIQTDGRVSIELDSQFARAVKAAVEKHQPLRVLESGTHHGTGTTRILLDCLPAGCDFRTIESSRECFDIASRNLMGKSVKVIHGLSVPRGLIPTEKDIAEEMRELSALPEEIYADFGDTAPQDYTREMTTDAPDDVIGSVMREWEGRCDLAMLDSCGAMGAMEFTYLMSLLKSPCLFVLDDTKHMKHWRTLRGMKADRRFAILEESDEKYGFCVAEFSL